ncbi:MAG: hypothetical protein E6Q97_20875 [Desulfurellales bacterium]|nr:MAG: hypothetical protein E6Q97_20875 [Desulfurellales bacterium]
MSLAEIEAAIDNCTRATVAARVQAQTHLRRLKQFGTPSMVKVYDGNGLWIEWRHYEGEHTAVVTVEPSGASELNIYCGTKLIFEERLQ